MRRATAFLDEHNIAPLKIFCIKTQIYNNLNKRVGDTWLTSEGSQLEIRGMREKGLIGAGG
jgi:hypothetical protein